MTFRFRKFDVYYKAKKLITDVYRITRTFPKEEKYGLAAQIRNAAISIALNIAEGSDRGSDREFNRFINMAIGSVNEVVAALDISLDISYVINKDYELLVRHAEQLVKQLSSFGKALKSR